MRQGFAWAAVPLFLVLAQSAPASAQSGVLDGPWIGCLTEDTFGQMTNALVTGDDRLRDSLLGTSCVVLDGQEFSVLGRISFGVRQIRVYVGDNHIDLIVPVEATQ